MASNKTGLIASLFYAGRPSAVCRRVVTVVVDAVDRMRWRGTPSHIADKRYEGRAPFVTDCNPTSAVVGESLVARVVATLEHGGPCRKFGRLPLAMDYAGLSTNGRDCASAATATTSRVIASKVRCPDHRLIAAIAAAEPPNRTIGGDGERDKFSKAFARQIDSSRHAAIISEDGTIERVLRGEG